MDYSSDTKKTAIDVLKHLDGLSLQRALSVLDCVRNELYGSAYIHVHCDTNSFAQDFSDRSQRRKVPYA